MHPSRGPTMGRMNRESFAARMAKWPLRYWALGAVAALLALQALIFGSFSVRVRQGAAASTADLQVQAQLAALAGDNSELRRMYTHLANQMAVASEELSSRGLVSDDIRSGLQQRFIRAPVKGSIYPTGNENRGCVAGWVDAPEHVAAVAMITFNRPSYLRKSVDSLLRVHRKDSSFKVKFPLFISQDGTNEEVHALATGYTPEISYLNHVEDASPTMAKRSDLVAYYRISNHYKFVLMQLFDCFQYDKVILVEDDMLFAPDFFSYFGATAKLLQEDRSLWCVSSWNDHGHRRLVSDPTRLVRSDFFPGLGWMTQRDVWDSLKAEWPAAYWDDWMRLQKTRGGRQCIRPEVCRTYNFGERGSSKGQFYNKYLLPIKLNDVDVDWSKEELGYLEAARFEADWNRTLAEARLLSTVSELDEASGAVKLVYGSQGAYEDITGSLKMIQEWKDGIPRGSYRLTVPFSWRGGKVRAFITPASGFAFTKPEGKTYINANGAVKQVRKDWDSEYDDDEEFSSARNDRKVGSAHKVKMASKASSWMSLFGGSGASDGEKKAAELRKSSQSLEQGWKRWKQSDGAGLKP